MNWVKENWFKLALIILAVWILVIASNIFFGDSFSIEVCLKEASGPLGFPTSCK